MRPVLWMGTDTVITGSFSNTIKIGTCAQVIYLMFPLLMGQEDTSEV